VGEATPAPHPPAQVIPAFEATPQDVEAAAHAWREAQDGTATRSEQASRGHPSLMGQTAPLLDQKA
jgi:hypothetical protein